MIILQIFTVIFSYALVFYLGYLTCKTWQELKIKKIIEETEAFKNICKEYMEHAKNELGKFKDVIERQNHVIEMLKMRNRER